MSKVFLSLTKGEFVGKIEDDVTDYIEKMTKGAHDNCVSAENETEAWKANATALSTLLANSNIPDDVIVAFEYMVPVGGGRIDCMLFGHDGNGEKCVVHIELKQWSNKNVKTYYDHHTFSADVMVNGYRQGTNITAHPSVQVSGYDNILRNHVKAIEDKKLSLFGFAYCYNYLSTDTSCALLDDFYAPVMNNYPLFCKDQTVVFAKRLKELLQGGNGQCVFEDFINSEIAPTARLYDVAANMLEGDPSFELIGEQADVFESILGAVKNTKEDEKTVIIVKGGPGTGKSVIAMRLLSELYKEEYHCTNVYYATRASSLRDGWKKTLQGVARRFNRGEAATSLILSPYDIKPYRYNNVENGGDVLIVDEAHRISYASNDQTDSHRDVEDRSYLPQILSLLYTSRVCVFFIDDRQSILPSEIGLSTNIQKAAENYYDYFKKANEIFEHGDRKYNGDDQILSGVKVRAIENNERISNLPLLTPNIKKVKVLPPFELKDQFRCNGSNNYLTWIDQILYEPEGTDRIPLKTDSYEFEVFDNPNDLNKKIRELDSFAVFADKKKEEMGNNFSYKALYKLSRDEEFEQSARLVAGWCWDWNTRENPQRDEETGDLRKEVDIPDYEFAMPWETQQTPKNDYSYKYAKNAERWCNQKEGVNQIGCIHSIQGWETDYVGVIIGPDLKWDKEHKRLCYNPEGNNHNLTPRACEENNQLILNTYRVLLTRGKKGCFVFACDPEVREYFKRCMNNKNEQN